MKITEAELLNMTREWAEEVFSIAIVGAEKLAVDIADAAVRVSAGRSWRTE